jgi:ABC-2 type transport system permease protein
MRRIAALAYRIFRQFLRDRRTMVLIFVVPIVIMSLLTWVLRAQSQPFRTAILAAEEDSAMVRDMLVNMLVKNANVEIVEGIDEPEIMEALQDGRIQGAIVMRGAGMEDLQAGKRAAMEVVLEGSDPLVGKDFARELQQAQKPLLDAIRGMIYLSDEDVELILPPEIKLRFLYGGEDFTETDYLAPPVIAFLAFFFVFLITAVSFLRERAQGTMERLMASPLTRFEIISGYLFGLLLFALAQTAVIMIFVLYILKIHYVGSLTSILVVELILVIGASNMGILFSSFAKNEFQVAQFIPLVIVPQVFLSGVLWSVETMPGVLQYIAYCLPLTYANFALRKLMIKGFALHQVWPELAALVIFALLMIVGSIISMRKSLY